MNLPKNGRELYLIPALYFFSFEEYFDSRSDATGYVRFFIFFASKSKQISETSGFSFDFGNSESNNNPNQNPDFKILDAEPGKTPLMR